MRSNLGADKSRLYKVLYGQQCHLYYISLYVKPSRSISILDENLRQIRRIELKDVSTIQRRILSPEQTIKTAVATYRDLIEFKLSKEGNSWLRFTLPSTEECEALCKAIQLQFGVPVYNYGSLNVNFRAALGAKRTDDAVSPSTPAVSNYRLVRDDYYASCVRDLLSHLGVSLTEEDYGSGEPPAEFSNEYPVMIDGTLEEGSYASFRSLKTPQMESFTVYRVEWYISTRRGLSGEFYPMPCCLNDMFYLHDLTIGRYLKLRVSKAVGTDVNRKYLYCVTTRGPVRLGNIMAHNMLLNVSKDNEVHNVLVCAKQFRALAIHLNRLPADGNISSHSVDPPRAQDPLIPSARTLELNSIEDEIAKLDIKADSIPESLPASERSVRRSVTSSNSDSLGTVTDVISSENDTATVRGSSIDTVDTHNSLSVSQLAASTSVSSTSSIPVTEPPASQDTPTVPKEGHVKAKPKTLGVVAKGPPVKKPTEIQNGKMRGLFRNLFDKGKMFIQKKRLTKAQTGSQDIKAKHPGPKIAQPRPKARSAGTVPSSTAQHDESFIEVQIQYRCAGLFMWTNEVELELKWTRLDVREYGDPSQPPTSIPDPHTGIELEFTYKSKDSTQPPLLPLTLRLSSSLQRSTLFHAMLFNKYRGSFYSIDQGEKDLHRGLFSEVKDAYAKICKHMGRRHVG
ncbi:hypothetical protein BaOVIS_018510 [Babesia ovis]|uniref:Uncharacterized protein n=1 Tax=Babesia ovis TaxID=5869 RepID=A0A9W5WVL6_BABOV|nr:hypothetical protein BaOVIS_018510 [Babesia ovis]